MYAWNAGPVYVTDISKSVVAIGRDFPFKIDLSTERSREGTSEGQQASDHFEAESPLMFRQRYLFKALVSEIRMTHRELRNKGNSMRKFYTGDLVVVIKQVKSGRKYRIDQKLVFKTKVP